MKATKLKVRWIEKITCEETFTVTWEEVMNALDVPEDEREGYEVGDEEVMDYIFERGLAEVGLGNEVDNDLVDSSYSDVSVIEVEPPMPPGQLVISPDREEDDRNENPETYGETFEDDHTA